MAEGLGVLPAKAFDAWIGGVRLERAVTEFGDNEAHMMVDTSVLDGEVGETYKEIPDGNLSISVLFKANMEIEGQLLSLWARAEGTEPVPIVIAHGRKIAIGETVSVITVQPTTASKMMTPKEVQRITLEAVWDGCSVTGILKSGQGSAAGVQPMVSTTSTDFSNLAVNTRGPTLHTDTVAVSGGRAEQIGVIGTIGDSTGSDATQPVLTIPIPERAGNDWRGQYPPVSAQNDEIFIYHKNVGRGVPIIAGNTIQDIMDDLNGLHWPDGFTVNVVRRNHQFIITGSYFGAGQDLDLRSRNPEPWRGQAVGMGGANPKMALETATGAAGSRVYTGVSDNVNADDHHLPVSQAAVVPGSVGQIGMRVTVDARAPGDPVYSFTLHYNLAYVIDGVFT